MKKTLLAIFFIIISCNFSENQKPIDFKKDISIKKAKSTINNALENNIKNILLKNERYSFYTQKEGLNILVSNNKIHYFIEVNAITPKMKIEKYFISKYSKKGKSFETFYYRELEKDTFNFKENEFLLYSKKYDNFDEIVSIQLGQVNEVIKKRSWQVVIPKGRFHNFDK